MSTFLSDISLNKKILLLTGLFTITFSLMLAVVFVSRSRRDMIAKQIEEADKLKLDLSNFRVSVNALHDVTPQNCLS